MTTVKNRDAASPFSLSGDSNARDIDPIRLLLALAAPIEMHELGEDPYGLERYQSPPGDPGLFGPGSVVWRVHSSLPALLFGGHSSLLLQSLHPLVMAGVADRSTMEVDLVPRLLRTRALFFGRRSGEPSSPSRSSQTYAVCTAACGVGTSEGVRIRRTTPHSSRMCTWPKFGACCVPISGTRPVPLAREKDRYLAEDRDDRRTHRGDATCLPRFLRCREYLRSIEPELAVTEASRFAFSLLAEPISGHPIEVASHRTVHACALDLLPASHSESAATTRPPALGVASRTPARLLMRPLCGRPRAAAVAEVASVG